MNLPEPGPRLSVVVVCFEMAPQIANTLRSLLPPYQRNVELGDFEIVLVDNGSADMLPEQLRNFSPNLRYHYITPDEARPSPARAMNWGARSSRGEWLCLMIDGARMLTPGAVSMALRLLTLAPRSVVEVRGWHLGPKFQPESVAQGYNHEAETELLRQVRWWEDGYRLFDIAADSAQTRGGLGGPAAESNCFFLSRELFQRIGGFDERFAEAGGGHLNLDFYARAVEAAESGWTLLGEGTFHQVHGGAATSLSLEQLRAAGERWRAEAARLRVPTRPVEGGKFILAGHMPPPFQAWLRRNSAGE